MVNANAFSLYKMLECVYKLIVYYVLLTAADSSLSARLPSAHVGRILLLPLA
jgi:hypothetical protein